VGAANDVKTLAQQFCREVVVAVVYIAEAHASDEWPAGYRVSFTQAPNTLEERIGLARNLQGYAGESILVDGIDNAFLRTFSAWPFRYFIIHAGRLALKAQPNPEQFFYNFEAAQTWLAANL